jgi:hypothetical protein
MVSVRSSFLEREVYFEPAPNDRGSSNDPMVFDEVFKVNVSEVFDLEVTGSPSNGGGMLYGKRRTKTED